MELYHEILCVMHASPMIISDLTKKRVTQVKKLKDAIDAGGKDSNQCTLILRGGPAPASVTNKHRYGMFPLPDKLLNARKLDPRIAVSTIKDIMIILGLDLYDYNATSLRYGHLMIVTDEDGKHQDDRSCSTLFKGLLINFFHNFCPSLLQIRGFLSELIITPFSKELLTEADIERQKICFLWLDETDGEAIDTAFSWGKTKERRKWVSGSTWRGENYYHRQAFHTRYRDFIYGELRFFSMEENERSIPSVIDGLNSVQRSMLQVALKTGFWEKEVCVEDFAVDVARHNDFDYDIKSICEAIIGMAQDFVGSNNLNLFQPIGFFGARYSGGKVYARTKHICTLLSPITRFIFPKEDENFDWYAVPIIPMGLVNGGAGIGVGWTCEIPHFNPRDVIANVRRFLKKESLEPMLPWYKGFKGTIEIRYLEEGVTYLTRGVVAKDDNENTIVVTELPIGKWTNEIRNYLKEHMLEFKDSCDENNVKFEISLQDKKEKEAVIGFLEKFELETTVSTLSMHLFDAVGNIKKYDTPEQILEEFCLYRLDCYEKRKEFMQVKLEYELTKVKNMVKFVTFIMNQETKFYDGKIEDLISELQLKGFDMMADDGAKNYDYLLSIPAIEMLSYERLREFQNHELKLKCELVELENATSYSLWNKDIERLEDALGSLF